jgi:hypothetical protein
MAKLQQMNEMTKQSSHFLLQDGYVTYKGKRYNDCTPAEKEAFNIVIGDIKPIDNELNALIQGLTAPLLLQYTMNDEEFIKPIIFEQLKAALQPENGNDHEGWWHLKSTCGCYTMRLSGCYDRGVLNTEVEVYKTIDKCTDNLSLTNAQWFDVQEALEDEYKRLVKDSEECERNRYYEELSHDNRDFI